MVIRKMKDKCKDAARLRREKERTEFVELSKLLPLPSSTTSQLDKASIIRLTSSYLRMRSAFPNGLGENWGTPKAAASRASSANYNARIASSSSSTTTTTVHHFNPAAFNRYDALQQLQHHHHQIDNKHTSLRNQITHSQNPAQQTHIRELGSLILQTLDGFVFALHRDGKIMYISETASVLLGLPQIDLTGSSIFEYVHPADHNDLSDLLNLGEHDKHDVEEQLRAARSSGSNAGPPPRHLELGRAFCMRMKCILPKRNAGLVHNGYKVIHCTGYLKVRCFGGQGKRLGQECQEQEQWDSYALVAVGHSLLPSASIEVKLNTTSFMFRAHLDMKLFYIEAPSSSLLGQRQADFVGRSLYQFIHVADSSLLEQAHRSLLSKSQVVSKYMRLMRLGQEDASGSVWMQMCACLVSNPRSMPKSQHIVGVCCIIGENQLDESRFMLNELTAGTEALVRRTTNGAHTMQLSQELKQENGNLLMVAREPSTKCALTSSKKHRLVGGGVLAMKRIKKRAHLESSQPSASRTGKLPSPAHQLDHSSSFTRTIGSLRRPSEDSSSVISSSASSGASSSRPPTAIAAAQMTKGLAPRVSCPCSASVSRSSTSSISSALSSSGCTTDLYSPPNRYDSAPSDGSNMISTSAGQQPLYLLHSTTPCHYVDPYTTAYDNHHYDSHTTWTTANHQQSPTISSLDHTQLLAHLDQSSSVGGGLYYQHHEPTSIETHGAMPYYEQHVDYTSNYHDEYTVFDARNHQKTDHIDIQTANTACYVGGDHSV